MPMVLNYCDIFDNCAQCPVPFCPYEKLDTDWLDEVDEMEEMEDQDDGW